MSQRRERIPGGIRGSRNRLVKILHLSKEDAKLYDERFQSLDYETAKIVLTDEEFLAYQAWRILPKEIANGLARMTYGRDIFSHISGALVPIDSRTRSEASRELGELGYELRDSAAERREPTISTKG